MKKPYSKTLLWVVVLGLSVIVPGKGNTAEFTVTSDGEKVVMLQLTGEIIEGDTSRLLNELDRANRAGKVVTSLDMYSPGGLVSEGISLGRVIRANRIYTGGPGDWFSGKQEISNHGCYISGDVVLRKNDPTCICASACALAWFGGVERYGVVGVHRSFVPAAGRRLSFTEQEKILDSSYVKIGQYLADMVVSSRVLDATLSTTSDDLQYFSSVWDKGIGAYPVWEEYLISWCKEDYFGYEDRQTRYLLHVKGLSEGLSRNEKKVRELLSKKYILSGKCEFDAKLEAQREAQLP